MIEREELSLIARERLRLGRGEFSRVVASFHRVADAGEGRRLSRSLGSCYKVPEMGGMGVGGAGWRAVPEDGGNGGDERRGSELSWAFKK